MNALTKLLIVLVTVLVLIQTAATVVFVHRVDAAVLERNTAKDSADVAGAQNSMLKSELAKSNADLTVVRDQAQAQVAALQTQLNAANAAKADLGVQLAQKTSAGIMQATENTRLAAALQTSEETKSKLTLSLDDLRKENADAIRQRTDVNAANSDLTNQNEVFKRENRFLNEQNAELQNQLSHASTTMPSTGGMVGSSSPMAAISGKSPAINATIRATKTIANIPYATISVGSADRVTKGMTFTLIDSQGNFLGFLMIDQVDANEAAGRLTGPRVAEVKAGTDARTQL